tara:strand:+ start:115 stop:333 length:219 start_codon:yes stop_codon:yes gene_type:complete
MNGIFNFVRFIAYSLGAVTVRKLWNWLNTDVDPIPFTKEFDEEYAQTKAKYIRLTRKKEEYEAYRKNRRTRS